MAADDGARGFAVTAVGPPESGKSELLWQLYARHAPRKLTLEVVPETHKRDPAAVQTFGFAELQRALTDCARRQRWHVIAALSRDDVARLFWILAPPLDARGKVSFARAVGGLALICGELTYLAARPLPKDSPIRDAYNRGRHHWLSLFGATQHVGECDVVTRLSAARCHFFKQVDSVGLDAIARASSDGIARRVAELPLYHNVMWVKSESLGYVLDGARRVVEVVDYRGERIARRDMASSVSGNGTVPPAAGKRQLPRVG